MTFNSSSSASGCGGSGKAATASFFFLGVATGLVLSSVSASYWDAASDTKKKKRGEHTTDNDDDSANNNNNNNNNLDERLPAPRRYAGAIKLRPDKYRRYRELHDDVWPQVLRRMTLSNIRNFTIYYHKETSTLFQHFEWIGHWKEFPNTKPPTPQEEKDLFDADMKAISDDPVTREWWSECEPCQQPFSQWPGDNSKLLSEGGSGDWWAPMECVTHCGHWPIAYTGQLRDPDFVKLQ